MDLDYRISYLRQIITIVSRNHHSVPLVFAANGTLQSRCVPVVAKYYKGILHKERVPQELVDWVRLYHHYNSVTLVMCWKTKRKDGGRKYCTVCSRGSVRFHRHFEYICVQSTDVDDAELQEILTEYSCNRCNEIVYSDLNPAFEGCRICFTDVKIRDNKIILPQKRRYRIQ